MLLVIYNILVLLLHDQISKKLLEMFNKRLGSTVSITCGHLIKEVQKNNC